MRFESNQRPYPACGLVLALPGRLWRDGTIPPSPGSLPIGSLPHSQRSTPMNGIIYLVGLIVIIMFILSFLGLR